MNIYMFRVMFVYDNGKIVACLVFYGDGTYVDRRTKLRIGVSTEFEERVFIDDDPKYSTLFYALGKINDNQELITERKIINEINSDTDFRASASVEYKYKYDKLGKQVFNNVLKRNNLVEFLEEEDCDGIS